MFIYYIKRKTFFAYSYLEKFLLLSTFKIEGLETVFREFWDSEHAIV